MSDPKVFFQSSLPRSGSTMLQNIIGQNPDFHVTPTDGLLELVVGAQHNYSTVPEFRAQDPELMKKAFLAFCKAGILAYHTRLSPKPYHVNKSRGWGAYKPLLNYIFMPEAEAKVICMVRDLRDVFASFEKIFRSNPDRISPIRNWETLQGTTIEKRMDIWASTPPLGLAIDRVYDIITTGIDAGVLFVKYEDLCLYPETEMRRIYQYLEVPEYEHDFDDIKQLTKEDDEVYGFPGLHDIRPKLVMKPSDAKAVLGNHSWSWVYDRYRWFYDYFGYKK